MPQDDFSTSQAESLQACISELDKLISEEWDKERLADLERLRTELLRVLGDLEKTT